jgi:hypothetical protein
MVYLVLAKTETVELKEGESFEIKDKNLTLIKFDPEDDKVIVCVNNEKAIVSDRIDKSVNGVTIHIKSVKNNYARLELTRRCTSSKCSCEKTEEDCSNVECFHECNSDDDCDDKDETTNDFCRGSPRKCINIKIEQQEECIIDFGCDDDNDCTIDKCISGTCTYKIISNCNISADEIKLGKIEDNEKENYIIVFFVVLFIAIIVLLFFNILKKNK